MQYIFKSALASSFCVSRSCCNCLSFSSICRRSSKFFSTNSFIFSSLSIILARNSCSLCLFTIFAMMSACLSSCVGLMSGQCSCIC